MKLIDLLVKKQEQLVTSKYKNRIYSKDELDNIIFS